MLPAQPFFFFLSHSRVVRNIVFVISYQFADAKLRRLWTGWSLGLVCCSPSGYLVAPLGVAVFLLQETEQECSREGNEILFYKTGRKM